jgi:hypothetical protein
MKKNKEHNDPIIYSARGKVCGIYQPSSKNFLQGILLTDDGLKIPAQLTNNLAVKLRDNCDLLKVTQVWKCYPSTNPPCFMLVKLKSEAKTDQELKRKGVNKFRIVGQVESVKEQEVKVLIKRNEIPAEGEKPKFTLTLQGNLPNNAKGQFWRFNVQRNGWNWTIMTAHFISEAVESQPTNNKITSPMKRSLSVKITEKEYQAVEAYAEKCGKNKTEVVREWIQKLPTFEPD